MIKKIWLIVISSLPFFSFAQSDCQDPYRAPDNFHIVETQYSPVCGCDAVTYRNSDAAYWWGGINYWEPNTICDNFDIDLYPTVVTDGSTVPPHLRIFMKYAGTATLTIYNNFGKVLFTHLFEASQGGMIIPEADPYDLFEVQGFPRGIYVLIVSVGGDRHYRKFIKVTE